MSVNFYEIKCRCVTNKSIFGVCDNEKGSPSYLDFEDNSKWNATVFNFLAPKEIEFLAIDNCIEIRKENCEMEKRCDCMLSYPDNIVFVELKNKGSDWIGEGVKQIVATLEVFKMNHNLPEIKHKRAFVANKKHPNFHVINNEVKKQFWDKYKVRLNIIDEINIK